jgi:hypothetical protein
VERLINDYKAIGNTMTKTFTLRMSDSHDEYFRKLAEKLFPDRPVRGPAGRYKPTFELLIDEYRRNHP